MLPLIRIAFAGKYDDLVNPKLQNDYDPERMASMVACASARVAHACLWYVLQLTVEDSNNLYYETICL